MAKRPKKSTSRSSADGTLAVLPALSHLSHVPRFDELHASNRQRAAFDRVQERSGGDVELACVVRLDRGFPALVTADALFRAEFAAKLTKEGLCEVDSAKCKACGACFKMGCPAMTRGEEVAPGRFQMKIDPSQCAGCKQCQQVCKFGAIRRVR